MIIAVTGHRPNKLGGYQTPNPIYEAVVQGLDEALMSLRPSALITGMALGVDQWAAELCIRNDIPFIAAVPFEGFESRWPERSQDHYRWLLSKASRVECIAPPGTSYHPRLLQDRNCWMVDNSSLLLAVWNGTPGGTANCVSYAMCLRKRIQRVQIPEGVWAAAREVEAALDARRAAASQIQAQGISGQPFVRRVGRVSLSIPAPETVTAPRPPAAQRTQSTRQERKERPPDQFDYVRVVDIGED